MKKKINWEKELNLFLYKIFAGFTLAGLFCSALTIAILAVILNMNSGLVVVLLMAHFLAIFHLSVTYYETIKNEINGKT